jgi:hypothetical protein
MRDEADWGACCAYMNQNKVRMPHKWRASTLSSYALKRKSIENADCGDEHTTQS